MSDSASNEDISNDTQWRHAIVTEKQILSICDEVGEFWRDLGILLELPAAKIYNFKQDCSYNRDRAWNVMKTWLQMKGSDATLGILTDALKEKGMRSTVEKLVGTEKMNSGLKSVRVASGKLRKDFDLLRQETHEKVGELNDIVHEMQAKVGEDPQDMKARVQYLETTIKQLETQEVSKLTRLGEIEEDLRAVQKSIKIISENQKMAAGRSLESDKNALDELNDWRQEETKSVEPIQGDTMQRDWRNQRYDGVKIKALLDESSQCPRCPALEKELSYLQGERDSLKAKIVKLNQTNKGQPEKIKELKRSTRQVKVEKNEAIQSNEKMAEEIQKPVAEKKELVIRSNGQIDLLKFENEKLSTQIEELKKKANSAEFECKWLQEELKTYINFQSHMFLPAGKEFGGICTGVICYLKQRLRNAPRAELIASRSSDGSGEASDVLNHKTGTISGTEERQNSWWFIDLGSSHRLVITHYALRHGKKESESLLTHWQLKGSNDGKDWENIETIHDRGDPQFKPTQFCIGKWSVKGEIGPFRFFRIIQTGVNSSGKYGIHLSGIELYGLLLNICELTAKEALTYKVFIKQPK